MQAPDLTEKIIGYRTWRLDQRTLTLRAGGAGAQKIPPWTQGVNTALCEGDAYEQVIEAQGCDASHPPELAPHPNCMCGLHAWHSIDNLLGTQLVVGAIAAWGLVEVHHDGFRAQHAEIVALGFWPSETWEAVKTREYVAELYAVPLVHMDELVATADKAGSPVPVAMRPDLPRKKHREEALQRYQSDYQRALRDLQRLRAKYETRQRYGSGITQIPLPQGWSYGTYSTNPFPPKRKRWWRI